MDELTLSRLKHYIPRDLYQAIQQETLGSIIKVFSNVPDQEFTGKDVVTVILGAMLLGEGGEVTNV